MKIVDLPEDFGLNFWSEWDGTEQWNLFYNFMSECLQLYLEIGLVAPIFENIEKKKDETISWRRLPFMGKR